MLARNPRFTEMFILDSAVSLKRMFETNTDLSVTDKAKEMKNVKAYSKIHFGRFCQSSSAERLRSDHN